MGTSITRLASELKELTDWQRTPEAITEKQYEQMVIAGIERLYIDTGRAVEYDEAMILTEGEETTFKVSLPVDEKAYALLCAQINFFRKVQSDVNNIVGYTTDALTVTNADKPYTHLKDTIGCLEQERRITFYKMSRYLL